MEIRQQLQKALLLLGVMALFAACSDGKSEKKDDAPEVVERTVLVYMMGDNTLSSSVSTNWLQIKEGAAAAETFDDLLVYVDQYKKTPVLYKLLSDGTAQVVKEYDEQNSASGAVFAQVLNDVFGNYPNNEKGLILWSHGEGWKYEESKYGSRTKSMAEWEEQPEPNGDYIMTKWIGQDLEAPEGGEHYLNIPDLKQALRETGTHLDFMLCDACFMGSVEVAYELRNEVDNFVISPAEIMGNNSFYPDHTGFPYKQLVPLVFKEQINYKAVTLAFYDYYNDLPIYGGMSDLMRSATVSWVVSEKLDSLAIFTHALLNKHLKADSLSYLNVEGVQTYDRSSTRSYHLYYDLEHVVSRIVADNDKTALNKWRSLLGRCVKAEYHTDRVFGQKMFSVCGLSVYVPQRASGKQEYKYDELGWYEDAGWSMLPGWSVGQEN